jgi:hypothetical protein
VRPASAPTQPYAGTVYLLHLDRPLQGCVNQHGKPVAGHYLGWTARKSPARRVGLHARGQSGSKYMAQARREGIGFRLARVWQDVDRNFERKLKLRKASGRLCPLCADMSAAAALAA